MTSQKFISFYEFVDLCFLHTYCTSVKPQLGHWKESGAECLLVGRHSSVARALTTKARCPLLNSRRRHFLSCPMLFQRSMDSNDAGCVLSTHCQEVFRCSPLPLCLSLDIALFQRPSLFTLKNFSCNCSSRGNNLVVSDGY